jgi:hypothetical protein
MLEDYDDMPVMQERRRGRGGMPAMGLDPVMAAMEQPEMWDDWAGDQAPQLPGVYDPAVGPASDGGGSCGMSNYKRKSKGSKQKGQPFAEEGGMMSYAGASRKRRQPKDSGEDGEHSTSRHTKRHGQQDNYRQDGLLRDANGRFAGGYDASQPRDGGGRFASKGGSSRRSRSRGRAAKKEEEEEEERPKHKRHSSSGRSRSRSRSRSSSERSRSRSRSASRSSRSRRRS